MANKQKQPQKENILNVPNALTLLRMALIGVFLWLFFTDKLYPALFVFLLAGLTDVLDGYIARKHGLITNFGKLMDPLADKLMTLSVLAALTLRGWVPVWLPIFVGAKELVMVLGGALMLSRGVVVQSAAIGKAATALFILAMTVTFFHPYTAPVDFYLLIAATVLTGIALLWYALSAVRQLRGQRPNRS